MSIVTAAFTAFLYAQQFAVHFNLPIDECPIELSSKACAYNDSSCDWHGFYSYKDKKIVISYNHYKDLPSIRKRELVWHELGHCAANLRDIRSHKGPDIMRQRVYSTHADGGNWDELVKRMEQQIKEK